MAPICWSQPPLIKFNQPCHQCCFCRSYIFDPSDGRSFWSQGLWRRQRMPWPAPPGFHRWCWRYGNIQWDYSIITGSTCSVLQLKTIQYFILRLFWLSVTYLHLRWKSSNQSSFKENCLALATDSPHESIVVNVKCLEVIGCHLLLNLFKVGVGFLQARIWRSHPGSSQSLESPYSQWIAYIDIEL